MADLSKLLEEIQEKLNMALEMAPMPEGDELALEDEELPEEDMELGLEEEPLEDEGGDLGALLEEDLEMEDEEEDMPPKKKKPAPMV